MAKSKSSNSNGSILNIPESNVEIVNMPDGRVALVFDPKKKLGQSASGKSTTIASTYGNLAVLDFTVGFNAYRKNA